MYSKESELNLVLTLCVHIQKLRVTTEGKFMSIQTLVFTKLSSTESLLEISVMTYVNSR